MLGVIVLWGIVPVLVKVLLSFFEPFSIAFFRLSQGWVLVLAVFLVRGQRVRDIQWNRWHLLGGIGLSLNFLLYALSLSYTTVSTGVLIVQFQSFLVQSLPRGLDLQMVAVHHLDLCSVPTYIVPTSVHQRRASRPKSVSSP